MTNSRLKLRNVVAIVASFVICVMLSGCGGNGKIKMTTVANGKVGFSIFGTGNVIVDWGDGSEKVMLNLDDLESIEHGIAIEHTYQSEKICTITVKGDSIMMFNIHYDTQLTSLDVKNNSTLESISCQNNNFTVDALNTLFKTLHSNNIENKIIYISNNPGADDCDRSIAERKGWIVR